MELEDKKRISLIGLIISIILLIIAVGITFAVYTYTRQGTTNSKQIVGDIYMHYSDSNQLTLENAMPSSTYDPTKYFEFTIDGKNTTTNKDIIYDIVISHGDNHNTRTERLLDKFLKFTLTETKNNVTETVVDAKSYSDLSEGIRIWKDTISKNTTSEVTHTYKLYMWISNDITIGTNADYDMDIWNDEVYASVKVNVTGDFNDKEIPVQIGDKLSKAILAKVTNDNSDVDSDNVTYISGCGDEETIDGTTCTEANKIDFNFVWYSGKLWRVVAIYQDGTMKLVTENPITAIYWGSNTTYNGSWVYQWLNEDFNDTLANKNTVLATGKQWNATKTSATTKPAETTMVGGNVGLLNAYEYTESYKKANNTFGNGYLNIKQYWWLITPYSSPYVRYVFNNGDLYYDDPLGRSYAVRPSIYLSSSITFAGGEGTRNNPYKISGDKEESIANTTLLNTRSSGEYLAFKDELYRIVGVEDGTTKIVKADYIRDGSNNVVTKYFASSVTFGKSTNTASDNYWDYYLNNTWLKDKFEIDSSDEQPEDTYDTMISQGTYYLGYYGDNVSYKNTICKTSNTTDTVIACEKIDDTNKIYTGYVGLLRVGEMFSLQLGSGYATSSSMWLITPDSGSYVRRVENRGNLAFNSPWSNTFGVRPSINLKSTIVILGGDGTLEHPFIIE